jgi:hypothetical protein
MMKNKYNSGNNKRKKLIIVSVVVIVLILSVGLILDKTGTVKIFTHNKSDTANFKEDKDAKTTSKTPSAQADYSDGNEREPGNTLNENEGTGVIKDTNGNIPKNIDTSQPVSSSSGEITVYTPASNSLIKAGQVIAGTSTLPRVTYRVLDDVTGMIAMGELNVVSGKFSGTIDFNTSSKNGRIDIFATKSDGSEYSTVEIPIVFR